MTALDSNECLTGSLSQLSPYHRDIARSYLEEKGCAADRLTLKVKQSFDKAIIGTYREAIQNALMDAGGDFVGIKMMLRKDKSLLSRWLNRKIVPTWDTLCLAVAAFDVDLGSGLPRGRKAAIGAIAEALVLLQWEVFRRSSTPLDAFGLACVHYASLSLAWRRALMTRDPQSLERAADAIGDKVADERFGKRVRGHRMLEDTVNGWSGSWYVFHYLIPYDWQYKRTAVSPYATNSRRT